MISLGGSTVRNNIVQYTYVFFLVCFSGVRIDQLILMPNIKHLDGKLISIEL